MLNASLVELWIHIMNFVLVLRCVRAVILHLIAGNKAMQQIVLVQSKKVEETPSGNVSCSLNCPFPSTHQF